MRGKAPHQKHTKMKKNPKVKNHLRLHQPGLRVLRRTDEACLEREGDALSEVLPLYWCLCQSCREVLAIGPLHPPRHVLA